MDISSRFVLGTTKSTSTDEFQHTSTDVNVETTFSRGENRSLPVRKTCRAPTVYSIKKKLIIDGNTFVNGRVVFGMTYFYCRLAINVHTVQMERTRVQTIIITIRACAIKLHRRTFDSIEIRCRCLNRGRHSRTVWCSCVRTWEIVSFYVYS